MLYRSLCQTRWLERHNAHEVFFALLPSILRALEAMSNERLFADQSGESAWNRDTDSKSKANNLLHAVSNFELISTPITTMKCLSILKPLSIKLQKRDINVYGGIQPHQNFKRASYKISEETSTNIARIGTAWLKSQRGKQRSSHLRHALLVGSSTEAMPKQEHRKNTTKERSQFLC